MFEVDILLDHQAHSAPGAPDVVAVIELTRVSNSAHSLTSDRSDNAGSQRNHQNLVTCEFGVFFHCGNAGQLQDFLQDGAGLVIVAEIALPVGHDLAGYVPGLRRVLVIGDLHGVTERDRTVSVLFCGCGAAGEVDVQSRCAQINLADAFIVLQAFPRFAIEGNEVAFRVAETVEHVIHDFTAHIINRTALRIGK